MILMWFSMPHCISFRNIIQLKRIACDLRENVYFYEISKFIFVKPHGSDKLPKHLSSPGGN